jgi:hypothetical protein
MPAQTKLSKTMINAYNTAHYRVIGPPEFTLLIWKKSAELAKLYKAHGVTSAMFITAYNPYSKKTDRNINIRTQKRLKGDLIREKLVHFEGVGGDAGQWVALPSYLVLGVTEDFAREMADKYQQNAVVWADSDAVPLLILMR